MALEHLKRKLEADQKAKPYTRTTIIIGPDGKVQKVTERVSLEELLADDDEWRPNPEDPDCDESQW